MTPTLKQLLEVPEYRHYFSTVYKLPANLLQPGQTPWRVWVHRAPNQWLKGDHPRYADAYKQVRLLLKVPSTLDVAISCRPKGYDPHIAVTYALEAAELLGGLSGLEWCRHCRRPVQFGFFSKHHAYKLNNISPYTASESRRCPFCAVREIAQ